MSPAGAEDARRSWEMARARGGRAAGLARGGEQGPPRRRSANAAGHRGPRPPARKGVRERVTQGSLCPGGPVPFGPDRRRGSGLCGDSRKVCDQEIRGGRRPSVTSARGRLAVPEPGGRGRPETA